ncbi:uncharacterized protein I206_104798 [Kwoniella pini CBS 10737]|uniref:DUF6534 domain-containing protein n=1 Tax=Kwoniella pini CBS 10737 TaxID=1296096 RepID=A0A1B9I7S3_9TREE|nr:uncharacterized protein I206_02337 [Kwoniella pini CBS 10737]OCF51622.1 hypothetical protein I206_02337 [Kwoniella pini CBS 10737]
MSLDISGMPAEQVEAIAKMAFGDNLGLKLGPVLLGPIFDAILYGIMIIQFQNWWTYCRPTERRVINYLTYYIMLAASSWTFMVIAYSMHNFVYNFGFYTTFLKMPYPTAFPSVGFGMSAAVQAFYVERTFRLNNRNIPLVILLIACILGELTAVIIIVVKCTKVSSELQAGDVIMEIRAWQCLTLATDFMITVSLAWGLWRAKTGWSHTDALVKRLILITLETQLAPTLVMLGFVIEMSIFPASTMGIFFDIMIPKAYTVGYLATLNTRVHLRRDQTASASGGKGDQTRSNAYHLGSGRLQQATVQVDTDTYVESYQLQAPKQGVNRDLMYEEESIENLDYAKNLSKRDLNQPNDKF